MEWTQTFEHHCISLETSLYHTYKHSFLAHVPPGNHERRLTGTEVEIDFYETIVHEGEAQINCLSRIRDQR